MENQALLTRWQQLLGQSLGKSDWLVVDQSRIDAFADATLDLQDIHVDPQARATRNLGGTIAHGYLTLSLLPFLSKNLIRDHDDNRTILNYGLNHLRFLHPVPANSRIRLHCTVKTVEMKNNGVLVTLNNTIEIEGVDKPALVADILILLISQ